MDITMRWKHETEAEAKKKLHARAQVDHYYGTIERNHIYIIIIFFTILLLCAAKT